MDNAKKVIKKVVKKVELKSPKQKAATSILNDDLELRNRSDIEANKAKREKIVKKSEKESPKQKARVEAAACDLLDEMALSDSSDNGDVPATGEINDDVNSKSGDTNIEDSVPESTLPKKITNNTVFMEGVTAGLKKGTRNAAKEGPQLRVSYKIPKKAKKKDPVSN